MPVDFILPAGGFVAPLPDVGRRELERHFRRKKLKPEVERALVASIDRASMFYVVQRDEVDKQPSPAEAKKALNNLRKAADSLAEILQSETIGYLSHFIETHALPPSKGPPYDAPAEWFAGQACYRTKELLRVLAFAATRAESSLPKGHTIQPRARLVAELKSVLDQAGMSTEPKGGSDLCVVVEIVLDALGELDDVKDKAGEARKVLAGAFGKRSKKARDK